MNVLSLFDGMSCGQLALNNLGIIPQNYYASEIDKYAIQIALKNFPNTKHIGNVYSVNGNDYKNIDLLLGGSTCTSFSRNGKQTGFNGASSIIYEYFRILKECQPTYFLLENVKMKNEWIDIISKELNVEPILINSNLLTCQNRPRLYWTNIPNVTIPNDSKIYLESILEYTDKNALIIPSIEQFKQSYNNISFTEKRTIEAKLLRKEHRLKYGKDFTPRRSKELVPRSDGKIGCLTTSLGKEHIILKDGIVRYLTITECEKLQTLPINYTEGVSDNQRIKMIGNGWTVKVIEHIFKIFQTNIG